VTDLNAEVGRVINASRLTWVYWNRTRSNWVPVESYMDQNGYLTCNTTHFSTWAVAETVPPTAVLAVDKTLVDINETVTLNATASYDLDGEVEFYLFEFGDGTNSGWTTLPIVTHEYATEGTYNATLIVMDDFGVTSFDGNLVYVEMTIVPEFSSLIFLPLFMVATLLAVIVYRRQKN